VLSVKEGSRQDTDTGGPRASFPDTSSTRIRLAQESDPAVRARALGDLVDAYWKPVYCLIRHGWRKGNEEAKDLTQDFFVRIFLQGDAANKFVGHGQFRAFIKSSVRNFMSDARDAARALKRGGSERFWSLQANEGEIEKLLPEVETGSPEEIFDAAWRRLLMARAIDLVEKRFRVRGMSRTFEIFRRHDLAAEPERPTYRTVGQAVGLGPDAVKIHLARARREFRCALSDIVWEYAGDDSAEELRNLFGI
jgi:RNA polymerase sigma-70 factor (ECF subfamily)